jgi:hypothetical protein
MKCGCVRAVTGRESGESPSDSPIRGLNQNEEAQMKAAGTLTVPLQKTLEAMRAWAAASAAACT